ncbi:unnamed protein product [Parascedosporium putredinis]|uniref:Uncharacterized protein n=1 Tax=Parascedosporium putredinis TaxID=1442378 RepID=A0A9P1MFJ3_9PEZI|nr:unnamed protein product [Parascedosporium putredinis]CAI8005145.1 unnamed protein product [Parascedosporium putredinis]
MMYSKTLVALVALVASVAAVPGCVPKPKYEPCGGLTPVSPRDTGCNEGFTCVSDPRKPGCGLACDEPGICVPDDVAICGGIGGFTCETGLVCFDKPDDNCDPSEGADCLGICLHPLRTARSRGGSKRRLESATVSHNYGPLSSTKMELDTWEWQMASLRHLSQLILPHKTNL